MPRYSPLPSVSIDPRSEADLVQRAAQVVYEASNRTLNDFSAGNPLAVLLEGQAFAQGEFLFWANQLPDKILIEWIGPFLGAMRKLGTPATAQLTVIINPSNTATIIPPGSSFSTNPQLTNGQSFEFVSFTELSIPAGETKGELSVYSRFVGNLYNVPANTITVSSSISSYSLTVTNPEPATGGSDVETFQEVQERFFTLIRRRNPVSETDWQDFFTDLYGVGTITSVQPNRSSRFSYSYETDYAPPNGQVSFFVLGPGGTELTEGQLKVGQNAINFSVPIENQGHLFPITLSEVQYNITLEVNPNGTYGANYKQSSLGFRNNLYADLTPNSIFPATTNPTVSDVDAAFYSAISANNRFVDPRIVSSSAYNTPNGLSQECATYTQVYEFSTSPYLLEENGLVQVDTPNPEFLPVLSNFTPYSTDKFDQTIYGNLSLKQIKELNSGYYELGDVVYYDGKLKMDQKGLHVVLENTTVLSPAEALQAIESGKISELKTYKPWVVGDSYQYSFGQTIDPDIVEYDYQNGEFIPSNPSSVPLNNRPGALVWLVTSNFELEPKTNDITGAQASFELGSPVYPNQLSPGGSYTAGTWVFTPQVASGPNQKIDPYYHYVDIKKGAVVKYAYVVSSFTYNPDNEKVSTYFNSLVEDRVIKEIVVYNGTNGLPVYRYKPRFKAGQYIEYKENTSSTPEYYIAAKFFTPNSTNIQDSVDDGLVINLTPSPELKAQYDSELKGGFSGKIGKLTISFGGSGYQNGSYNNVPLVGGDGNSATADIIVSEGVVTYAYIDNKGQKYRVSDTLTVDSSNLGGTGQGLILTVSSLSQDSDNPLTIPARMFTFFRGDTTFFRNGNTTQSYTATSSVTPLFNFEVYYNNGVFVETQYSSGLSDTYEDSIPYYNPIYKEFAEDTVLDPGGRNFYRVMRAFNPQSTVTNWAGVEKANSCRFEEYAGNLLRFVKRYTCEERIMPQFGNETSSIKLGVAQITIIPKGSVPANNRNQELVYIWESTQSGIETPELSWYTGTSFQYSPPKYGPGTLEL